MQQEHDQPWRQGMAAARANVRPGAVLLAIAVGIVAGYHLLPPMQGALDQVADWKLRAGVLFAACSTAVFGGLLPMLVQQARPSTRQVGAWTALPFFVGFWAIKGVEIDLLYRFQAWMFGDNAHVRTIIAKVAFDEFVYCTLWGVPSLVIAYAWHENGYNWRRTWQRLGARWYRRRVVPVLLANWAVWIPTVAAIYCLKLPLQLPVQNLVLCLWAIMVMFMARSSAEAEAAVAAAASPKPPDATGPCPDPGKPAA